MKNHSDGWKLRSIARKKPISISLDDTIASELNCNILWWIQFKITNIYFFVNQFIIVGFLFAGWLVLVYYAITVHKTLQQQH